MLVGSRRLLFIGLLILFLGGMSAYQSGKVNSRYESPEVRLTDLPEQRVKIENRTQRYYSACGHYIFTALPAGIEDNCLSPVELEFFFPSDAGWQLKRQGELISAVQKIEGLCPGCAPKRHLAFKDGLLAIYHGPAGSLGPLERVTDIKIDMLPVLWQEEICSGRVEFQTEKELLQALDSLDDYR